MHAPAQSVVEFETNADDRAAVDAYLVRSHVSPLYRLVIALFAGAILAVVVFVATRSVFLELAVLFLVVMVTYQYAPLVEARVAPTTRQRLDVMRGEVRVPDHAHVAVDSRALTIESGHGVQQYDWFTIGYAGCTADHLVVRPAPDFVVAIPRRAFAKADAWNAFTANVNRCWMSAKRPS